MNPQPAARPQSPAEERANSLSHGLGFLLAAAAWPVLWQWSTARGGLATHAAAVSVFALTMMALYAASALCHGLPPGRAKHLFDRVDRAAIYLFIAGSYTPFAATALVDATAWAMLGLVWLMAGIGVAVALLQKVERPLLSTGLYVALGWLVLLAALPWIGRLQALGMGLLVAGGAAYTLGAVLFLLSARLRFAHLAWHLMVMLGSGLHVAAVGASYR